LKQEVQVFGEQELLDYLDKGGRVYSHCISIRNPDQAMPNRLPSVFKQIMELKFYDVSDESQLPHSLPRRAPGKKDARRVIRFFKDTKKEATGYTIHCWHGHSRSTAAALAILYMLLGTERAAVEHLVRIRPDPKPSPNLGWLAQFDRLLGSDLVSEGKRLQAIFIEELRKDLIALFPPLGEIEELPAVDDERGP